MGLFQPKLQQTCVQRPRILRRRQFVTIEQERGFQEERQFLDVLRWSATPVRTDEQRLRVERSGPLGNIGVQSEDGWDGIYSVKEGFTEPDRKPSWTFEPDRPPREIDVCLPP